MVFLGRIIGGPQSVRAQYSSSQIRAKLGEKNLKPQFILTVHRIKGLSIAQFDGLNSLVDNLKQRLNANYEMKLLMPPPKKFKEIDFDRLLNHREAMEKVYQSCFLQGGFVIDLRFLDVIYSREVLKKENPEI